MIDTELNAEIPAVAVPEVVLKALRERRGEFTDMRRVFECIHLFTDEWVGVAGDGDNASYEYFIVKKDQPPEFSDVGYGCTATALRDVLVKVL